VKIKFVLAGAALAGLAVMGTAIAANANLHTFGSGDVTLTGADSAEIVNEAGEYGGVYLPSKGASSKLLLADVQYSFTSTGAVGGGAPRFSIPIDTDGNGTAEGYAFLDVNNCAGDTFVSTTNLSCITYFGNEVHQNWSAFAAAHPTYRIAPGSSPFIIADVEGSYAVEDIDLR
jgi:hypothetical protein